MKTQKSIKILINDKEIECHLDQSLLEVAFLSGIYIPTLCYHPNLSSFGACGLCAVEIEGESEPVLSCKTMVKQGMVVKTSTPEISKYRREKLALILKDHPHACLVCAEREGCAREPCSLNVPMDERCCELLGDCELQRVADFIGIAENTPRYKPKKIPILKENPYIFRNYNLCIGCGRCIRACSELRGLKALDELPDPPALIDPSVFANDLNDSKCQFCSLCIHVCPTGALVDRIDKIKDITPCQYNCPANIDIPIFLRQIADGSYDEAISTIYKSTPFPATLGYVCYSPCENECRRSELDKSVSIRVLKRFAFEQSKDIKIKKNIKLSTGKKVAIIGAGPAGLSCAFYLALLNHNVTVFEAENKPGGMLRYAIPTFRLPRDVLDKEIKIIQQAGVDIKVNNYIKSLDELKNQGFDSIFIGIGAQKGFSMGISGENDPRVIDALVFLKDVSQIKNKVKLGENVAVIGGGNTAIDAARTAVRLGSNVTIFYRRSESEMPAYKEEIEEAKKEGIKFEYLINPVNIYPDKDVLKVEFVKNKLGEKDSSGRPSPIAIKNSNFFVNFDNVITAIGQKIAPFDGINLNSNGSIDYNSSNLSIGEGLFIGGDIIKPSSVVDAVALGKKAAIQIHKYLGFSYKEDQYDIIKPVSIICDRDDFLKDRVLIPLLDVKSRFLNFDEIEKFLDEKIGNCEAKRCLQCDLCLYLSKIPQPPVEISIFNVENVALVPEDAGVYIAFNKDKDIIEIKGVANLRKVLEEKLKDSNDIKFFKFEEDPMYSKRESELLQQYIKQHGEMPSGGDDLDELF